uniref:FAD-binding protein n=1 Tax=Volvariella volvacea TaxID=36659 RepID=M9Z694_9AGAR|nr:FAD-binding protein [Volvariella volvacea]
MSTNTSTPRKAVVVGAGPVGCLAAIALAKSGWNVELYESRPDMRIPASKSAAQQRSINLAISHRGLAALEVVDTGAAQRFLKAAIPMRGRMIHDTKGNSTSQPYDKDGQCINSIDRALLNQSLLDEVTACRNVQVLFNRKLVAADFDHKSLTFVDMTNQSNLTVHFDFCVGADGSYSVVRRQMMRVVRLVPPYNTCTPKPKLPDQHGFHRMNYQQEYIRDVYIELRMPAGRDSEGKATFLLDPNHLHIWPRHSFMLIALPNKDKTFTCTLFAPSSELDRLNSADAIVSWFRETFPDALNVIGEKNLVDDFMRNPRSPLMVTKAMPYHYKDRAILLGDAAHSMVPFYGQGLNCGLEDVRVLYALFLQEGIEATSPTPRDGVDPANVVDERLARALAYYSDNRYEDLLAIQNLAMNN